MKTLDQFLNERLGGKGYSRQAAASSVYPGKKGTGDWEDSDRGAGNKAARRAGKKVEKKSPTYKAHVLNKESVGGGVPITPQELEIQKKMSRLNVRLARKRSQQMQKAKVDDTETAPEQVKEASAVLDANKKISNKEKRDKLKKELATLTKRAKAMKKHGSGYHPFLHGEEVELGERTLSSYIPSDRQGEARRANLDYVKAQLKKKEDQSTKNRGDLSKRDAGKMAKERLYTKKIMSMGEAKVDKGRSDYGKATIRNYRRSGPDTVEPAMFDPENKRGKTIDKRREEHKARRGVKKAKVPTYKKEEVEIDEGKKKGLWDNIHAKRKRGEKPAKPGDKDYPKTLNVEGLEKARKNVGADKCWDGYKAKGTKKKGGKEVPNCVKVDEGAAWTKKSGKNPEGGLNEKGRKSYERENPGSDLKAPQPEGGSRKKSFCARMGGMKKKLTSSKTANDPDSRINKALRKWKCNEEDKAFNFVLGKLKDKYGSGVMTKGDKMPEPSAAQKKKNAAIRAKRAKEDHRDPTEKASDGRYSDRYSNRGSD